MSDKETDIKVAEMSQEQLDAELKEIKRLQAIQEEADRREEERKAELAKKRAEELAKQEAERKKRDQAQREKEWAPAQTAPIPPKCPYCQSELMKKPPKNHTWKCSSCGAHKH
jgi:hypothetical protein